MTLTREMVLDFLQNHTLMQVTTVDVHPWIASVYYGFDTALHLYFLSLPSTLHCRHIAKNPAVAVAVAESSQKPDQHKCGLQLWGYAKLLHERTEIERGLGLWQENLGLQSADLRFERMEKGEMKARLYRITPKKIKLFDQERFPVEDGQEPVLEI